MPRDRHAAPAPLGGRSSSQRAGTDSDVGPCMEGCTPDLISDALVGIPR